MAFLVRYRTRKSSPCTNKQNSVEMRMRDVCISFSGIALPLHEACNVTSNEHISLSASKGGIDESSAFSGISAACPSDFSSLTTGRERYSSSRFLDRPYCDQSISDYRWFSPFFMADRPIDLFIHLFIHLLSLHQANSVARAAATFFGSSSAPVLASITGSFTYNSFALGKHCDDVPRSWLLRAGPVCLRGLFLAFHHPVYQLCFDTHHDCMSKLWRVSEVCLDLPLLEREVSFPGENSWP